jgi:hypothetical protein
MREIPPAITDPRCPCGVRRNESSKRCRKCSALPLVPPQGVTEPAPARRPGNDPAHRPRNCRLFAHPPAPVASRCWLAWRRRHQVLSAWYHQRTRLARNEQILMVT